jgi:hypothetical protein
MDAVALQALQQLDQFLFGIHFFGLAGSDIDPAAVIGLPH